MRIPMRKTAFAAQGPRVKPEDCARYARLLHPSFADLVVLAGSLYPIPSRTRPLNSPAPMVLSLKAWKSRSLPGLPRTDISSRSQISKAAAAPPRRLLRSSRSLEHDPEKWIPVFGKDHAPRI